RPCSTTTRTCCRAWPARNCVCTVVRQPTARGSRRWRRASRPPCRSEHSDAFLLTFPDCRRECAQAVRRIPSLILLLPLLLSVVWLGPSCTVPPTWIAQTQHGGIAYFLFASGSLR